MNCPRCGYKVDQDFGVFTCPQCQSVLFIDLDGNVQVSDPSSQLDAKTPLESEQMDNSATSHPSVPVEAPPDNLLNRPETFVAEGLDIPIQIQHQQKAPAIQSFSIPKPILPQKPINIPKPPQPPSMAVNMIKVGTGMPGQKPNPFFPPTRSKISLQDLGREISD